MADDRKRISEINTVTTDATDNYLLVVENPTTGESEQCSIDTLKDTAFGSAAALDAGMEDGQVPVLEIDDDYNVALPAVSASQLTDFPAGMNEGDLSINVAIDVAAAPFGRGLQIGIAGVPTTVLVDFSTDQDNAGFILADAVTIEEQAHGIFWSRESGETAFAALADLVDIFADVSMALSAPEIIVSGDTDNEISVIFPTSGLGVDTGGAKLHNVRNINYKPITGNVAFNVLDFGYAHLAELTLDEDLAITDFENIQELPDGAVEDHTEFLLTVTQGYPGEWTITQWPANVIWLTGAAPDFSQMAEGEKRLIHFYYDQLNMYGWYQPFYYEIKQAYEANDDTNAFTDDEKTKLSLISATQPIDLDAVAEEGLVNQFFLAGTWDASTGTFPFDEYFYGGYPTGAVFRVIVAGTVDSIPFAAGDLIVAIVSDPSETEYVDNWLRILGNNIAVSGYVSGSRLYINQNFALGNPFNLLNWPANTFLSIGPTGSGANEEWSDMDDIPVGSRIAVFTVEVIVSPSTINSVASMSIYARMTGSPAAVNNSTRVTRQELSTDDNLSGQMRAYSSVMIPLDAQRRFDATWIGIGNDGSENAELRLQGFYL